MLDVFFSVDVEVWCESWEDIDARFPRAFQRYIYGKTPRGEYGLRYQLKQLQEYGLSGVFFVEPLFSTRFGPGPLAEIVGLIREYGQEVQAHMHTEWVSESWEPLIERASPRRQFLHQFDLAEQTALIGAAVQLIEEAGGGRVNTFRAGSFGLNRDTLRAVAANGVAFDSSYNASLFGRDCGVMPGQILVEPTACDGIDGVIEYPMTVFNDGTGKLRHMQLAACSSREIEGLLWQALEAGRKAMMILSHNFEILNLGLDRPDPVMVKRFDTLCRFLDRHRDCFRMRGFHGLTPDVVTVQPPVLTSPLWKTGHRMMQQTMRRRYG